MSEKYEPSQEEIEKAEEMAVEGEMTPEQEKMSEGREELGGLINKHLASGDKLCHATMLADEMIKNADLVESEQLIMLINQGVHQEEDDITFVKKFLMLKWKNIKGSNNIKHVLRNIPEDLSRECIYMLGKDELLNKLPISNLIDLIE